ncbi:unnamed protein product [Closterium sp. Naga37s-1]|nr:unnamed protein product [Closterium sp. Naga37s-1]
MYAQPSNARDSKALLTLLAVSYSALFRYISRNPSGPAILNIGAMLAVKKEGLKLSTLKAEDQEAPAISESFEADSEATAPYAAIPASTLVPFPLLLSAEAYTPWTIPFRSAKDPPGAVEHDLPQKQQHQALRVHSFAAAAAAATARLLSPSFSSQWKRAAGDESVENAAEKAKVFEEK